MIRFLLALIILTLLISYAIVPFVKYIMKFFAKEAERIDKAFNNKEKDGNKE